MWKKYKNTKYGINKEIQNMEYNKREYVICIIL